MATQRDDTPNGVHRYSTFSASTIQLMLVDDDSSHRLYKYFCCLCRLSSKLVFHPVGPFRCVWDLFIMMLLVYTSIEVPFTMAFGHSLSMQYIGLCVDTILLIDIIFNFHTAYFDKYDNVRLVTDKKYICKKYFRTWFFVDFLTCIPFDFVAANTFITYIKIFRLFRLFRIIKLIRLFKLSRIFDVFRKQFIVREATMILKILKISCGMLIFAHFAACLWWYVGLTIEPSWVDAHDLRHDHIDTFTKYSYSWYWAVVTLFTTGYGDVVATNAVEQWVCSICILIGTCFFAYFIGTLTVLITEGDKVKAYEFEKLEEAHLFCEQKKLPKELTHAICTHIQYHCRYNYIFDESELLNLLPSYLRHDIQSHVAKQFLLKLQIFQNEFIHLPEFIIGLIAIKAKSISCNQFFKLYDINDTAKHFYIQRTGSAIMCNTNDELLCELGRGDVMGEYSSFLFKKRTTKVKCLTWSEFYSISVDDIREILDTYYPKSSISKWKRIQSYLKSEFKKNTKHNVTLKALHGDNDLMEDGSVTNHYSDALRQYTLSRSLVQVDEHHTNAKLVKNNTMRGSLHGELQRNKTLRDENDMEDVLDDVTVDADRKEEKSKPPVRTFSIFGIRSNSDLRNSVVAAHVEKHRSTLNVAQLSELTTLKTERVTNIKDGVEISFADRGPIHAPDSECSYMSTSSGFSSDDKQKKNKTVKRTTFRSRKMTQTRGTRRRKVGKFRRRGLNSVKRRSGQYKISGRMLNKGDYKRSYDESSCVDSGSAVLLDALTVMKSYELTDDDISGEDIVINIGGQNDDSDKSENKLHDESIRL